MSVCDPVEVRSAGDIQKGMIVGGYEDSGFGYGTYKVHLEGEKYCNGHVLDTRINANFVFPLRQLTEESTDREPADQRSKSKGTLPDEGRSRRGEEVMYSSGTVLWFPGAKIESYDAAQRRYHLRLKSGSGDVVACHSVSKPGAKIDNGFFVGKWDVRITGRPLR